MGHLWVYIPALISNWAGLFWAVTLIPDVGNLALRTSQKEWFAQHFERVNPDMFFSAVRVLFVFGLFLAGYFAWDEQYQIAISKSPESVEQTIKGLSAELADYKAREWPELKPKTIEALKSLLMKAGRHEFDVFSCASQDCDSFADGFRTAFFGASWFQRPHSISKLVFKFPQGWVIAGYGDKTGMDALHDAIKKVLHVDVPTLNYPPNPDRYVQLMIGPKPKDLQLSQQ
jgi:hypothetical protein